MREEKRDRQAEKRIDYINNGEREDLVYTASRNLPAWAKDDPQTYFRMAEHYERANGNAFEEWKITLPHELRAGQNMDLMRDLVDVIAGDRLPITYAFHAPKTLSGNHAQPHLHLLISGRQGDGIMRTPAQHFKRYNAAHPERGGAQKDPALYHAHAVKQWRITITDVVNLHLERAGRVERMHPDSLKTRELDRLPEPKLLPSESQAYREKGVMSEAMAAVLDIRASRTDTEQKEQANARAYWAQRKEDLGISLEMDGREQLSMIVAARTLRRDQAPRKDVVASYAGVEQDDRQLGDLAREVVAQARAEAYQVWDDVLGEQTLLDYGWAAVRQAREEGMEALRGHEEERRAHEHAWERTQAEQDLAQAFGALTAQLDALSEDTTGHGRVRIRLWDRDQGLGI